MMWLKVDNKMSTAKNAVSHSMHMKTSHEYQKIFIYRAAGQLAGHLVKNAQKSVRMLQKFTNFLLILCR